MEPGLSDREIEQICDEVHKRMKGTAYFLEQYVADAQLRKALTWAQHWLDTNLSEDYGFADAVKELGITPWEEHGS